MFWNEVTVNTMIMVYVVGLFALIIVCLYALIQSKANKLYTFIIIPLALIMASMTWQGIKLLQGMPVYGLPEQEEVEVMWVNDNKPWIYVVLKKEGVPVLYKIDWSEENKKKMKELQKKIGSSLAQGKFKMDKSHLPLKLKTTTSQVCLPSSLTISILSSGDTSITDRPPACT